jgi:hypothetical protein
MGQHVQNNHFLPYLFPFIALPFHTSSTETNQGEARTLHDLYDSSNCEATSIHTAGLHNAFDLTSVVFSRTTKMQTSPVYCASGVSRLELSGRSTE